MGIDDRAAGLHRVGDDRGDVDRLLLQPDLAPGDARDLQQVVDELRHLPHLVVDHVAGPAERGVVRAALLHDLDGVADRGQGIAELVAEHRQELVLARVGLGELAGVPAELVLQPLPLREVDAEGHDRRARGRRAGSRRGGRRPGGRGGPGRPCGGIPPRSGVQSPWRLSSTRHRVSWLERGGRDEAVPGHRPGVHLGPGVADHLQEGVVGVGDVAVDVAEDHAEDVGLDQAAEPGLAGAELAARRAGGR